MRYEITSRLHMLMLTSTVIYSTVTEAQEAPEKTFSKMFHILLITIPSKKDIISKNTPYLL